MLAIFDLDGTLLNTLPDIAAAANQVLADLKLPTHDFEAYRKFTGNGVVMLFRRAVPSADGDETRIAECVERFFKIYAETWKQQSRPYDGIEEMLTSLGDHGVPLAVLSNKPHVFTVQCVEHFLGRTRFAAVYGQREGVPRKPDPSVALQIAEEQGIAAGNCYFLGDSNVDMQTACAAGMHAVGCTWGFRPARELSESGATVLVDSPADFTRLLLGDDRV